MANPLTIAEKVFALVKEFPENPAVEVLGECQISLTELWSLASSYAEFIESIEGQIALVLPRSPEWIAAILGCWIQGKAPVILDPEWPRHRIQNIKKEASITFTISEKLSPSSQDTHPLSLAPNHPAYLIYSSGSTGQPKGIVVPHAGLVPMLEQQVDCFRMHPETRSLWLHGIAFDASISDLGTALLSRATLCIDPEGIPHSGQGFLSRLAKYEISHIDIPPALLAILDAENTPSCLRSLVIGGSVCPPDQVRNWAKKVHLVNVYGPTEATVCTSMVVCSESWDLPLIGNPIKGISYEIITPDGHPANEGELLISGPGVALGYLHQPELTRSRFFKNEKVRTFRSGDRVRRNEEGDLIFLGRLDRQFKQKGKLICPEEIESALLISKNIRQAHVAPLEGILTAWIIPLSSFDLEKERLALSEMLPSWMVPTQWFPITEFPTLPSGKIDPNLLSRSRSSGEPLDKSTTGMLTQIVRDLLGQPDFSPRDDFFHHGGDSLAAMQFLAGAEKIGHHLPPDCLYQHRSVHKLCQFLNTTPGYAAQSENLLEKVPSLPELLPQAPPTSPPTHFLLTGATGFLGSAVLGEILNRTQAPVTCLVRGNLSQKRKLITEKLRHHGYPDSPRIQIIQGDLEAPRLGLSKADWISLSMSTTHLIHCAASTHSLAPYHNLEKANVTGTASILQLQHEGFAKRLIYASTLSVFVDATPLPEICVEDDLLTNPTTVFGGYAQSKWVAEKLVQKSPTPPHIIRFGLLTANQKTGYAAHDDALTRKLIGTDSFPHPKTLPSQSTCDFTPVDYAASVLVDILLKNPSPRIFHIANPHQVPATTLYQAISDSPFELEVRDPLEKKSPLHQTSSLFKTSRTRFSTTNTEAVQSTPCPKPTHDFLVQFFKQMHTHLHQR